MLNGPPLVLNALPLNVYPKYGSGPAAARLTERTRYMNSQALPQTWDLGNLGVGTGVSHQALYLITMQGKVWK